MNEFDEFINEQINKALFKELEDTVNTYVEEMWKDTFKFIEDIPIVEE